MKPLVNLQDAFRDSPDFRNALAASEQSIAQLESVSKGMVKTTRASIELQQELSSKQMAFCNELNMLAAQETDDQPIERALKSFISNIYETEKARKWLGEQLNDLFITQSEVFVKRDLQGVKESRRQFDALSDKFDASLDKYAGKKQHVPNVQQSAVNAQKDSNAAQLLQSQLEQAAEEVSHSRFDFHSIAMQHAGELNTFQRSKRVEYLETILAYINAQSTFYHQGYELMKELEPVMNEMSTHLYQIRKEHEDSAPAQELLRQAQLKQSMDYYNPLTRPVLPNLEASQPPVCVKSGYLMKKGSGKLTVVWSRRWFSVQQGHLVYETRGKKEEPTVAANLRLCSVKPCQDLNERRFCFEVISPNKAYILQAENALEQADWISVLQNAIGLALNTPESDVLSKIGSKVSVSKEKLVVASDSPERTATKETDGVIKQKVAAILAVKGNEVCADCGQDQPDWASINLGVLLCIECSGIHRGMGVQVSKVRSLSLDKWDPEAYDIMLQLGNVNVNSFYEKDYNDQDVIKRATPKTERIERERWINSKYVAKKFVQPPMPNVQVDQEFWDAMDKSDFVKASQAISWGAQIDYKNQAKDGMSALQQAVVNNNSASMFFATLWNADIKVVDNNGWTALHLAVKFKHVKIVANLLKRRADTTLKTTDSNQTALDIAIELGDPELVTMLRLHQFELEQGQPSKKAPSQARRSSSSEHIPPPPDRSVPEPPSDVEESLATRFGRMSPTKAKAAAKNFFQSVRQAGGAPVRKSNTALSDSKDDVHRSSGGISSASFVTADQ